MQPEGLVQSRDKFLRLVAKQLQPTPRDIDEAVRKAPAYVRHHHDHYDPSDFVSPPLARWRRAPVVSR
jgi:hypothetical protein